MTEIPSESQDRIKREDVVSWSQHYDRLQWEVIKIFTAGVAAMSAAAFSDSDKCWPVFGTLGLATFGILYVASFRAFRKNLHGDLPEGALRRYLARPSEGFWFPKQWDLFVWFFVILDVLVVLLHSSPTTLMLFGLALAVGVSLAAWIKAGSLLPCSTVREIARWLKDPFGS